MPSPQEEVTSASTRDLSQCSVPLSEEACPKGGSGAASLVDLNFGNSPWETASGTRDTSAHSKSMRPKINSPSTSAGSHRRILECAFAVEPSFLALAEAAEQAGWKSDDVSLALFDLAVNRIIATGDDDEKTVYDAVALALKELNRP
jgi:hypothetical protein